MLPPAIAVIKRVDSRIRHFLFFALFLSVYIRKNAIIFIIIRKIPRNIIFLNPYFLRIISEILFIDKHKYTVYNIVIKSCDGDSSLLLKVRESRAKL